MTVIELPLIHRVKYRYCKCQKSNYATNVQQCMRNRWYPATVTDPATCATFKTLETFRLQNVVGNMNVHDFITAIERQTNALGSTGVDWVPVRPFLSQSYLLISYYSTDIKNSCACLGNGHS